MKPQFATVWAIQRTSKVSLTNVEDENYRFLANYGSSHFAINRRTSEFRSTI